MLVYYDGGLACMNCTI